MALTRAQADSRLVRDNRHPLELLQRSTVDDGTNADTGAALSDAMLRMGYAVASVEGPTDAELAAVPYQRWPYLFLMADLRLKESLHGWLLAWPSESDGVNRVEFSDMARATEKAIARLREDIGRLRTTTSGNYATGRVAPNPKVPIAVEAPWEEVL